MNEQRKGIIYAFIAYGIWGIFPLYWKLLSNVNSLEILINRVIWSFIFTTLFIFLIGQRKLLLEDLKSLWQKKKLFWSLLAASFVITCNWYLYIWGVTHNHVVDASLGYYINPLLTVLFGVIFFKEKLSKAQLLAVLIAFSGLLVMTVNYGKVPWIALLIAFSFATYGALKKKITLDATRGLAIETLFILPFSLVAYIYIMLTSEISFLHTNWKTDLFLIIGGIVTAYPLIMFAKGAKALPQYLIGFIQYISPTILLLLGVILYNESFTKVDGIAFGFIWLAIIIFTVTTVFDTYKRHLTIKNE